MSGTENPPTAAGNVLIPADTPDPLPPESPPSAVVDDGTQDPPTAPGPTEIPGDTPGPAVNPDQ